MISNTGGLCALVECGYLNRKSTGYSKGNIQVNPKHTRYVADKVIIINSPNYPIGDLETLVNNKNLVISRLPLDFPGVVYKPYLPRYCDSIMWNGMTVDYLSDTDPDNIEFEYVDDVLYVPKAKSYNYTIGSFLEFLAYQTGSNVYSDTEFIDLDIVKTGKGIFPEKIKKRRF
jgi:hypothetical protein